MRRSLYALGAVAATLLLADARADDEWVGGDKRAHFPGGVIVAGITSEHTGSLGPDFAAGCLGAVSSAFIAVHVAPGRIRWSTKF